MTTRAMFLASLMALPCCLLEPEIDAGKACEELCDRVVECTYHGYDNDFDYDFDETQLLTECREDCHDAVENADDECRTAVDGLEKCFKQTPCSDLFEDNACEPEAVAFN